MKSMAAEDSSSPKCAPRLESPGEPGDAPGGPPAGAPVLEPDTHTITRLAPRYRVLIHNDDVTTVEFVVQILTDVFRLAMAQALTVMLEAHQSGAALVGVYSLEEAEFRVDQAHSRARTAKYPLTFTYEPEEAE